jgi:hypothetical protein
MLNGEPAPSNDGGLDNVVIVKMEALAFPI